MIGCPVDFSTPTLPLCMEKVKLMCIVPSTFHTQRSPCKMTGLISSGPVEFSIPVHEFERRQNPTKQFRNDTSRTAAAKSNEHYFEGDV